MKRTAVQRKAALLEQFVRQRDAIRSLIAGFPLAARKRVFLGTWSALDLLAHLTGWDSANEEAVQTVMAGRLPAFYAYRSTDWADFNAMLVARCRLDSLEEMIEANRSSQHKLLNQLSALSPVDFVRDFGVRYRGYRVTVERLIQSETADEGIHLPLSVVVLIQKEVYDGIRPCFR